MGGKEKKTSELTFEESLTMLEHLAREMESGKLPLEEALEKYEEGAKLFKLCKEKISNAEKRISKIKDSTKEEI